MEEHALTTPRTRLDSLAVFAMVWAWAETIQPLNTHVAMSTLPGWLLPIATVLLLCFPSSTLYLFAFLIFAIARTAVSLPFVPNHVFFMLLVNLTLLAALLQEVIRGRGWQVDRESVFNSFAAVARWQLVLLYLFAAFAKLNVDYFNPEVSCAVALFDGVRQICWLIPGGSIADQLAIYSSVFFEIAIPLCLIFPRTRAVGIAMALFFHMAIAIHPLWATSILTFTMVVFAMLVLFMPREVIDDLGQHWQQGYDKLLRGRKGVLKIHRLWIAAVYAVTLLAALAVVLVQGYELPFEYVVAAHTIAVLPHFGSCFVFAAMVASFLYVNRQRAIWTESQRPNRIPNLCWLFLVVVIVNGLCPYVGLKTTTAFTMFSNLRTESSLGNHWLVERIDLFGFQDELVLVVESNDPLLQPYIESGDKLTKFELQRLCSRDYACPPGRTYSLDHDVHHHMFRRPKVPGAPVFVRYRIGDAEFFESVSEPVAGGIFEPHPWYQSRLLAFRPVLNPNGPAPCDH